MEVGDLYEEDHHRLDEAVAALERCFARGVDQGLIFPRDGAGAIRNPDRS